MFTNLELSHSNQDMKKLLAEQKRLKRNGKDYLSVLYIAMHFYIKVEVDALLNTDIFCYL